MSDEYYEYDGPGTDDSYIKQRRRRVHTLTMPRPHRSTRRFKRWETPPPYYTFIKQQETK